MLTTNLNLNNNSNINEEDKVNDYSDWQLPISFINKRYIENIEGANSITQTWRMKERMKTVSVALVLCLNVGVDPPDIVKTQPCARLECWIDPLSMSPQKALETIGGNLQKQYERWQPRARYKQSLDPTVEEVKKLCSSLRRNAKEERVLFHYNGHGVPKPTSNGEVWVFNRTYTQYIPLSVYDLQTWMGAPSIYVYDCSNAGIIVDSFKQFAEQHETEFQKQNRTSQSPPPSFKNCIQLAACSANQILPMNPDLPADIFTSCLTTPIKIALRWFVMQNSSLMAPKITLDLIDKIPGQLNDRRTMLGELNWIFTAITDTIAWNTLPRDVFQKLFRQDLLVASLFRNFLLAERIMRSYDCTPVSWPPLPPTYQHAMWQAWDLALDLCLAQLPGILEREEPFVHSPFFEEQLTAFQVWLSLGSEQRSPPEQLPIVLQVLLSQVHRLRALELLGRFLDLGPWAVNLALSVGIFPYVLKLLQSSAKELRPLLVFIWSKILAVDSTCQTDLVRDNGHKYFLSVLGESSLPSEHRTLSAFVLASIVNGYPQGQEAALQGSLVSICLDQLWDGHDLLRQWLAIGLARLWSNYDRARWTGVRDSAHEKLFTLLSDPVPERAPTTSINSPSNMTLINSVVLDMSPLVRKELVAALQWMVILFESAFVTVLIQVRASAVYALGTFVSSVTERSEHANNIDHSLAMTLINSVVLDMSPLVRKELVAALQWMVILFESAFVTVLIQEESGARCAASELTHSPGMRRISSRDRLKSLTPGFMPNSEFTGSPASIKRVSSSSSISSLGATIVPSLSYGSIYTRLWHGLTLLDQDPHPGVRTMARIVTTHVRGQMKCQQTSPINLFHSSSSSGSGNQSSGHHHATSVSLPPSPSTRPTFLSGDSPPPTINNASSNEMLRLTASIPPAHGGHSNHHSPGNFINTSLGRNSRNRKILPNTITEEMGVISTATVNSSAGGEDGSVILREPLVTTQFVPWSSRYFAQSVMKCSEENDMESHLHFDREWRYQRNRALRLEAVDELRRAQSLGSNLRFDNCIYSCRAANPSSTLLFHPYEPHLLVGIKDTFGLIEWCSSGISSNHSLPGSPSVVSSGSSISSSSQSGKLHLSANRGMLGTRITAMQMANAHDVSLLFTGSDDGSVRLWSNYTLTLAREPNLVTAWQALSEMRSGNIGGHFNSPSPNSSAGLVMSWNQRAQLLLVTGDVRFVRLWDANTELKLNDIPTGADSCVTSLSCSETENALMCVGCGDGSVRLLDRRNPPQEARIGTWREHRSWVVDVHLDESANRIISGSVAGDIRVYDTRQSHTPLESHKTSQGMTAMAVHSQADLFACGFVNQYIGVYSKRTGQMLHTIKHQGFMSPRVGPVSCLAFHPYRLCLAAGSIDTTISVYGLSR